MMTRLPRKAETTEELKRRFAELAEGIEAANQLLKKGHVLPIDPTNRAMREFVSIGMQLHERGVRINLDVSGWDERLLVTLQCIDPRIERFMDQRRLKQELLKKHAEKLRRKRQGPKQLPGGKPAGKRLPG